MIRVAICDDEPIWIQKAYDLICDFCSKRSLEVQIDTFDSAERLLNMIINRKEFADILILDIDMPEINGFIAAEKIKKIYPEIILLFYTSYEQYVFEAFKFQPFRYIRKQFSEQEMVLALNAAIQVIESCIDKSITLKTADENRNVRISDIMFFETNKRRCDVHLRDGKILNVRKTIKELYSEVGCNEFILIHSGASVNIKYIKSYSSYDVTLENGTRLIVSRSHIKDVKTAVTKYWGSRL